MQRLWTQMWVGMTAVGRWTRQVVTPSDAAWTAAAWAMVAVWALWAGLFTADVAPYASLPSLIGLAVMFAVFAVVSLALLLVFWLFGALKGRFRAALILALPPSLLVFVLMWGAKGTALGLPVAVFGLSLVAGSIAALGRPDAALPRRIGAGVFLTLGLAAVAAGAFGLLALPKDPNPALAHYHLAGQTLGLPDPGKPGPYRVRSFTYGSGTDRHRPEYAGGALFRSQAVDGAKLDERWTGLGGWNRTRYWGFDAHAFPVQGRVWMPDTSGPNAAKGPFPLVLIVHGNHEMADYSDVGYAYLGELLASQGFILVSVDENFLNSSIADFINPVAMRMGGENSVRAWLLLEHLRQWRAWTADPHHPMFGKADMNRIGLIGHSRGGEAVATANAFNRLDRDPDDATVPFDYHFNIGAVAAIAPVDGQYRPRGRPTPMENTNYFVIQGSLDGDLNSFMGAAQYSRDDLKPPASAFKASLYVKDANHGQFNTAWGRYDFGLPFRLFLDPRRIMDPQAQRRIAKVYLSAFLRATLCGQTGYRRLFQDARLGAAWLPDDYMLNNYDDDHTVPLADYEEDLDPTTGSFPGARIRGANLSVWRERAIDLKVSPLDSHAAVIGWDERVHASSASYAIERTRYQPRIFPDTELVFSVANAEISSLPRGFKPKGKAAKGDDDRRQTLDWTVVVTDTNGVEARLPLSHDQPLYPQVRGETRRLDAIGMAPTSETVMRRYRFALKDFVAANPRFDPARLSAIRFDFDRSKRGVIVLDDVGLRSSAP